jgi:hypothetical protein
VASLSLIKTGSIFILAKKGKMVEVEEKVEISIFQLQGEDRRGG